MKIFELDSTTKFLFVVFLVHSWCVVLYCGMFTSGWFVTAQWNRRTEGKEDSIKRRVKKPRRLRPKPSYEVTKSGIWACPAFWTTFDTFKNHIAWNNRKPKLILPIINLCNLGDPYKILWRICLVISPIDTLKNYEIKSLSHNAFPLNLNGHGDQSQSILPTWLVTPLASK